MLFNVRHDLLAIALVCLAGTLACYPDDESATLSELTAPGTPDASIASSPDGGIIVPICGTDPICATMMSGAADIPTRNARCLCTTDDHVRDPMPDLGPPPTTTFVDKRWNGDPSQWTS